MFENDFEEGNYSAWTDHADGGIHAITNAQHHHGIYSDHCVGTAQFQTWVGVVYKDIVATDEIHMRNYMKFNNLPSLNTYIALDEFRRDFTFVGEFRIRDNGGVKQVGINSVEGGATYDNYAFATGVWYCMEFVRYKHATNGYYRMYIDGTLVHSQTPLNTSLYDINRPIFGVNYSGTFGTPDVFQDCCKIDSSYIGLEPTNVPLIYNEDKILVEETTNLPSTSSAVVGAYGARVRTMRHLTPISPWTAS